MESTCTCPGYWHPRHVQGAPEQLLHVPLLTPNGVGSTCNCNISVRQSSKHEDTLTIIRSDTIALEGAYLVLGVDRSQVEKKMCFSNLSNLAIFFAKFIIITP